MTAHVIDDKPWSYVLFDDGTNWILTLLIDGVVEFGVSVRLLPCEIDLIRADRSYVAQLVETVKQHRSAFADREIEPPVWP